MPFSDVSGHNESAVGCENSINQFLRCPCKQSALVPVGRKHHLLLKEQLAPHIFSGRISMRFCRPHGEPLWHVKLDKAFQPPRVTFSFLPKCSCSPVGIDHTRSMYTKADAAVKDRNEEELLVAKLQRVFGSTDEDDQKKRKSVSMWVRFVSTKNLHRLFRFLHQPRILRN